MIATELNQTTAADRVNILLVDDQPAKLMTYEAILSDLGENLIKATSAQEALEYLLREEVAVVLVDVCMPDLDGFELATMIRQHPRHQRTAIILVSAVLMTDLDRLKGYSSGALDYLPVPVVPEILRAKVAVFAELYRKTRELEVFNRELERRVSERTAELEASTKRQRKSQEALREADRRKDHFLAVLAHELRNPLAPIRNATKYLMLRGPFDNEFQWNLDVVDRQVNHLTRLIDDLLDVSRINRGRLELRCERVALGDVIASALESSRPLVEQFGHELEVELPSAPLYLNADLVRLSQVFMNLLNNAAKYTPKGGRIRLAVEHAEGVHGAAGEILVRVSDNGVGIEPEKLPSLFDMFVQLDDSRGRSQGGLGIGLALVRHLVDLHGGAVEARSPGVGQGSEFVVRLPALPEPGGVQPAVAGDGPSRTEAAARRILVVDDLQDSAASLALVLRRVGNEVETAYGGLEAVALAESFRPQVVLLDLGMPVVDGLEACRRIRAQPWSQGMVIVALTGWGQEEDRRRAFEAGFDAHLVKPLDHGALLKLLAELAPQPEPPEART